MARGARSLPCGSEAWRFPLPPRPLPEKCGTWEMETSKVFCFVFKANFVLI